MSPAVIVVKYQQSGMLKLRCRNSGSEFSSVGSLGCAAACCYCCGIQQNGMFKLRCKNSKSEFSGVGAWAVLLPVVAEVKKKYNSEVEHQKVKVGQ